jgi:hypothetical protein
VSRLVRYLAMIALGVTLSSCVDKDYGFNDVATRWVAKEGFSVSIERDGEYTFCDRGKCFGDAYSHPGASDSIAIILQNFYSHAESARFREEVLRTGIGYNSSAVAGGNLDFTISGKYTSDKWCGGHPCVFFGAVTTSEHVIFFREKDG